MLLQPLGWWCVESVIYMPNTWKLPEMNMYLGLNLATFQYIYRLRCYHFCLKPFNDRESQYIGPHSSGYDSPGDWTRELSKATTDSESLRLEIEKECFSFSVWGSLEGLLQVGVFCFFCGHLYLALDPNPLGHYFGSRFFWKLGQNPRLWSPWMTF